MSLIVLLVGSFVLSCDEKRGEREESEGQVRDRREEGDQREQREKRAELDVARSAISSVPDVSASVTRRRQGIQPIFMGWHEVQRTASLVVAGKEPWKGEWESIMGTADAAVTGPPRGAYLRTDGKAYDADTFVQTWMKDWRLGRATDGDDLWAMALAWIFNGNPAYCAAGAKILREWADKTLLGGIGEFDTPELQNIGLPIALALTHAVYSYELLSGCLSETDGTAVLNWFERGKDIVLASHTTPYWTDAVDEYNNHLSIDNLYLGVYGFLTNNTDLVTYAVGPKGKEMHTPDCLDRSKLSATCNFYNWKQMIQGAIFRDKNETVPDLWGAGGVPAARGQIWDRYRHFAPNPMEAFKHEGYYYSSYHVYGLTMLAEAAYHRGYEDLYRWSAPTGESLGMAYLPLARMMRDNPDDDSGEQGPHLIESEYSRSLVGFVGHSETAVRAYYNDGGTSRGAWTTVASAETRRQVVYPPDHGATKVVGFAWLVPAPPDYLVTYFDDGKFVKGSWSNLGTVLNQYGVPADHDVAIVAIQGGGTMDIKAFYSAGPGAPTVASQGSEVNLAGPLTAVQYPAGYGPADVAGMADNGTSEDIFTYFKDGTVSRGSWTELAKKSAPKPYSIDSFYSDDIEGNQLFWGETLGSKTREWMETPLARWGGADYDLARATCAFKPDVAYGGMRRYDPTARMLTAFQNGITYDDIGWEFDYGSADGWTPGDNEQATFTLNDGDVLVTSTDTDPQMISPPIRIFPSAALARATDWKWSKAGTGLEERCKSGGVEQLVYTKIALELSAPTPLSNNQISVFWDNGAGFNATNSINFTMSKVLTTPQRVVRDLSSYTAWTRAPITRLRVDPTSSASKVRVHSIRLLR